MATDGKLIFIRPADGTGRLTFGDGVETPVQPTGITIDATFADDMRCSVQMLWDANVSRGFGVQLRTSWGEAEQVSNRARSHWQNSESIVSLTQSNERHAEPVSNRAAVKWQESEKFTSRTAEHWQDGAAARASLLTAWQEAEKLRASLRAWWQDADTMRHVLNVKYQEAVRLRHTIEQHWQDAEHRGYLLRHRGRSGLPIHIGLSFRWQDVMRPRPGKTEFNPVYPPEPPCYEDIGRLEFVEPWANNGRLVFVCIRGDEPGPGATVIVPVRSVYMTINSFSLKRLDNDYPIMANSMSLSLDVDSWTWTCSFSVNGSALPTVARNSNGDPVVARATINGTPIDFLLEQIRRDRSFGSSQLRVQGRGLSAQLDDPYAPVLTFGNPSSARTARQLLDDILTINGVSNGWGISAFDPTDWYVPAGVFAHQGSYISAMNQVVGSVGAYLQPQDTGQNMDVRMRYPTPSWEWSGATPDIVLPSAVTSQEGIDWVNKPDYSRVFVIGQESGVLGRYTREGTDGAILAPGVVDPLITHVDAVRQRGRTILSQTGTMANVTLRLPVLAETGIIRPGKMVRYTDDGVTRIGMTRSVGVDVAMPTIYQTIEVETYV